MAANQEKKIGNEQRSKCECDLSDGVCKKKRQLPNFVSGCQHVRLVVAFDAQTYTAGLHCNQKEIEEEKINEIQKSCKRTSADAVEGMLHRCSRVRVLGTFAKGKNDSGAPLPPAAAKAGGG